MKKLWIALGAVILVGLAGFMLYLNLLSDKTGPQIVFDKTDFVYHEGDSYDGLLSGVSAKDEVDGDVSDSLMVISVLPLTDKHSAKVQYVAKDKKNNLSITNLMVDYIPSDVTNESKKTTDSTDTSDNTNDTSNTSADALNSTDPSTDVTDTFNNTVETETANSIESVESTETTDNTVPESYPYIKLSSKEITLKKGTIFDVLSVVEKVEDDMDTIDVLSRRIQVYGDYYTNKVGTYQLKYYVTDTERNQSNIEYLTLNIIK